MSFNEIIHASHSSELSKNFLVMLPLPQFHLYYLWRDSKISKDSVTKDSVTYRFFNVILVS